MECLWYAASMIANSSSILDATIFIFAKRFWCMDFELTVGIYKFVQFVYYGYKLIDASRSNGFQLALKLFINLSSDPMIECSARFAIT